MAAYGNFSAQLLFSLFDLAVRFGSDAKTGLEGIAVGRSNLLAAGPLPGLHTTAGFGRLTSTGCLGPISGKVFEQAT